MYGHFATSCWAHDIAACAEEKPLLLQPLSAAPGLTHAWSTPPKYPGTPTSPGVLSGPGQVQTWSRAAANQVCEHIKHDRWLLTGNFASWILKNSELRNSYLWPWCEIAICTTACRRACGTARALCAHSAGGEQQVLSVKAASLGDQPCKPQLRMLL